MRRSRVLYSRYALLLLPLLYLAGCDESGRPPEPPVQAGQAVPAIPAAATTAAQADAYPFRTAVIVMENSMSDGQQVLYVEDHGRRTAMYTTVEMTMLGETIRLSSVEIYRDGWQYNIDLDERTGTKRRSAGAAPMAAVPDVASLTAEMKTRYNLRELGTKEILGRPCHGYAMEAMGMKMVTWNWNNIPMYSETDMGGAEPLVVQVMSIETDLAIAPEKFHVPDDIVFTEG